MWNKTAKARLSLLAAALLFAPVFFLAQLPRCNSRHWFSFRFLLSSVLRSFQFFSCSVLACLTVFRSSCFSGLLPLHCSSSSSPSFFSLSSQNLPLSLSPCLPPVSLYLSLSVSLFLCLSLSHTHSHAHLPLLVSRSFALSLWVGGLLSPLPFLTESDLCHAVCFSSFHFAFLPPSIPFSFPTSLLSLLAFASFGFVSRSWNSSLHLVWFANFVIREASLGLAVFPIDS